MITTEACYFSSHLSDSAGGGGWGGGASCGTTCPLQVCRGAFCGEQQAAPPNTFCLFCTQAPLPIVGWWQEDGPSHLIICLGSEVVSLCPSIFLMKSSPSPHGLECEWWVLLPGSEPSEHAGKGCGTAVSMRVGLLCFRGAEQREKLLSCLGKLCWKENMPYTGVLLLSAGNLGQKEIFLFLLFLFLCRHL